MTSNTSTAIFNRLTDSGLGNLSPEAASSILTLDFSEFDHARMAELSSKAQTGTLSADEGEELGEYLRAGDMLAILKLKARRSLERVPY